MDMKIDKSGREKISAKIDNVFSARACLLVNPCDFSPFCDDFEAIPNSIRENQTGVCEDHAAKAQRSTQPSQGFGRRLGGVQLRRSTPNELNCLWMR